MVYSFVGGISIMCTQDQHASADCDCKPGLTRDELKHQSDDFCGRGGTSAETQSLGLVPGFRDSHSGRVFVSRFADGRPAPMHLLDGLPQDLVVERGSDGSVLSVCENIVAGFLLGDRFMDRDEAVRWSEHHASAA